MVDDESVRADGQAGLPPVNPYDFAMESDGTMADRGQNDMRAKRRRAWTVVGLAIVIPAAVAGIVAWQLFGSDAEPAPTVTRVTTTPAETETQTVQAATATPAAVAVTPTAATDAADTTASAAATTATTSETTTSAAASTTAAAEAESAVDLSSLDPAARLAAWTEIETIEVLPGETLWLIAQNYETTISAIATLNNISDPSSLSVGQLLLVPVGFAEEIVETAAVVTGSADTDAAETGSTALTSGVAEDGSLPTDLANWHSIAPVLIEDGDSLEAIAIANNTSVEAIMALNGITDSNLIFIGEELLVPVGFQGEVPGINLSAATVATETTVDQTATDVQSPAETTTATETGTGEAAHEQGGDDLMSDDEGDDLMSE